MPREFCGAEPELVSHSPSNENGRVIGGAVLPHTIPMYEARHRPTINLHNVKERFDQVRRNWTKVDQGKVYVSTHWMPTCSISKFNNVMQHQDGCDTSYQGVEPQLFSFPGDPELAALIGDIARSARLPVRRIHRVAQEHAVWVPGHLLCRESRIPLVPCSIWWRGPREAHRRFGEVIGEAVRKLGRRAFFIASGGLSHTFDFSKPPEYVVPQGERFDRLAKEWLEKGQHGRLLDMSDDDFETWNPEGRAGHLYMMRGALEKDVSTNHSSIRKQWGEVFDDDF